MCGWMQVHFLTESYLLRPFFCFSTGGYCSIAYAISAGKEIFSVRAEQWSFS